MRLYKLSGAGNDFLAWVDDQAGAGRAEAAQLPTPTPPTPTPPTPTPPTIEQIVAWCRRGVSLGADGFLLLRRSKDGAVRVVHHDADGSRPELCLNGARCAAELAASLGWGIPRVDGELVRLVADAGPLEGLRTAPGKVRLTLPDGLVDPPVARWPVVDGRAWPGVSVRVGGPHYVIDWAEVAAARDHTGDLSKVPIETLGPALRHHRDFDPAGTNVHFVVHSTSPGDNSLRIRSFERGVEGETLACGTGAIAAAVAAQAAGRLRLPITAHSAGGFDLHVSTDTEERLELEGDARCVAIYELLPGASELPERPDWMS